MSEKISFFSKHKNLLINILFEPIKKEEITSPPPQENTDQKIKKDPENTDKLPLSDQELAQAYCQSNYRFSFGPSSKEIASSLLKEIDHNTVNLVSLIVALNTDHPLNALETAQYIAQHPLNEKDRQQWEKYLIETDKAIQLESKVGFLRK